MPVNATDAYVSRGPSRATLRLRESEPTESRRDEPKTSAERAIDESTSARTDRTKRVEARPDAGGADLAERRSEESRNGAGTGGGSNSILDANRGRNVNISA